MPLNFSSSTPPSLEFTSEDGLTSVVLKGEWTSPQAHMAEAQLQKFQQNKTLHSVLFDFSSVIIIDSLGVLLLAKTLQNLKKSGKKTNFLGLNPRWLYLFNEVEKAFPLKKEKPALSHTNFVIDFIEMTGKKTLSAANDFLRAISLIGAAIVGRKKIVKKNNWYITSCLYHIMNLGINAIPVIMLISATVGAIITQQGALQLKNWGAETWVVALSGKMILRETGVLLAAVMIAGRSGSAITAEIGSMKIREEIDALSVMGLDPFRVLIFPRLLALMISLPLLTVISDFAGLIGAGIVENLYSGFSWGRILELLHQQIKIQDFLSGIIKSPFMALAIALISCMEGMKVQGSVESLGKKVTSSVVRSIFVVILLDGIFTMFFKAIKF